VHVRERITNRYRMVNQLDKPLIGNNKVNEFIFDSKCTYTGGTITAYNQFYNLQMELEIRVIHENIRVERDFFFLHCLNRKFHGPGRKRSRYRRFRVKNVRVNKKFDCTRTAVYFILGFTNY